MKFNLASPLTTALIAGLSLSVLTSAHAQFTYTYYPNDTVINNTVSTDFAIVGYSGGSYNDDFSRNFTGPSSPTVHVVAGANVNEIDAFNNSTVSVTGGNVGAIAPQDNTVLNIHSGANVGFVLGFDSAVINMHGGHVDDLEGQGHQINVNGGTMGALVANVDSDFLGNFLGSCIVNVRGGEITGDTSAFNDGILNIYGGKLGSVLRAAEGGTINIFGNDLTATLFDSNFGNGYSLYSLTGTLEDGNSLDNTILRVRNDGVTYGHSSFHLIPAVPELGACAPLLGLGVIGVTLLKHRRKHGIG